MSTYLTDTQLAQLLRPINPVRVSKDPKGNSHVEAYEIRSHLNRIFGFGRWDEEVLEQALVYAESFDGGDGTDKYGRTKLRHSVCWRSIVRLTVRTADGTQLAVYTEGATCDATNQVALADAHDQALKGSASQALKRCAMNLGDQFGLSLYNKGSMRPLVGRILIWETPAAEPAAGSDVSAHITTPLAPEAEGEPTDSQRETSSPSPSRAPSPRTPETGPVSERAEPRSPAGTPAVVPAPVETADSAGQEPEGSTVPSTPVGAGSDDGGDHGDPDDDPDHDPLCVLSCDHDGPCVTEFEPEDPTSGASETAFVMGPTTSTPAATSAPVAANPEPSASPTSAVTASEQPPDPSVGTAATGSPAESGAPVSSTPSAPEGDPATSPDVDPYTWIVAQLDTLLLLSPQEALKVLNNCMELTVRYRLRERKMPDGTQTLNAALTSWMKRARTGIEKREAAAKEAAAEAKRANRPLQPLDF